MSSQGLASQPSRPSERDALLNPAFVSLVLAQVCAGYVDRAKRPLPLSLAFVAIPIILHGPTRSELPRQARSKLAPWLDQHPVLRAGFALRARSLRPAVQAGIRAGLRSGVLSLDDAGLHGAPPKHSADGVELSLEVNEILDRAKFVGGWIGLSGPPAGIYALWRVRP